MITRKEEANLYLKFSDHRHLPSSPPAKTLIYYSKSASLSGINHIIKSISVLQHITGLKLMLSSLGMRSAAPSAAPSEPLIRNQEVSCGRGETIGLLGGGSSHLEVA